MNKIVSIAVALLALSGCAQVGQLTAVDAQQAAALAQAIGDTSVVPCYAGFAALGNAAASATKPGILTAIEEKRGLKMQLQNPACTPLWLDVLTTALKGTPLAPLVP